MRVLSIFNLYSEFYQYGLTQSTKYRFMTNDYNNSLHIVVFTVVFI